MVSYIARTLNGIFQEDKRVYVDKRLPGMEYAQAGILLEPGTELLVSYETIVAEMTGNGWVHVYGLFGATTRKHIASWGKRHNLSYAFLKSLYEERKDYNIYTGEYTPAKEAPIQLIGVKV